MKESKAIINKTQYSMDIDDDDSKDITHKTASNTGDAVLINCFKCQACGHSFVQNSSKHQKMKKVRLKITRNIILDCRDDASLEEVSNAVKADSHSEAKFQYVNNDVVFNYETNHSETVWKFEENIDHKANLKMLFQVLPKIGCGDAMEYKGTCADIAKAVEILNYGSNILLKRLSYLEKSNDNRLSYYDWLIKHESQYNAYLRYMLAKFELKNGEFVLNVDENQLNEIAGEFLKTEV